MIWGTDVNVQETKEKFKDFLKYFMDDSEQAGEEEPMGGVEPYYMVRLDEVSMHVIYPCYGIVDIVMVYCVITY